MGKKIASLYAEIGADTTKLTKGLNDTKGEMIDYKGRLGDIVAQTTGLSLSSLSLVGGLTSVGKIVRDAVLDWSEYAETMSKAADLSGVSAEEMSRLTQAADDFRVSQDSLMTAMQMALKNGFTPTIENIAQLSDKLLAIEDPAKRAEAASKIFGRQWDEIAPLLLKGGDAIREGTDAIADNLIVTEEAVELNKEYIAAMDNLDDAMVGMKNQLARGVIPAWTDFLELVTSPKAQNAADLINTIFKGTFLESDESRGRRAAETIADNLSKIRDASGEASESIRVLEYDMSDLKLFMSGPLGDELASFEESQKGLKDEAIALQDEISKLNGLSWLSAEQKSQLAENKAGLLEIQGQIKANAEEHEKATKKILFNLLEQQLAMDGLSEAEGNILETVAEKWGMIDTETLNAYRKIEDYVSKLESGAIPDMQTFADLVGAVGDKNITITTTYIEEFIESRRRATNGGYSGVRPEERAIGGEVFAGMPYWVGERGAEPFVPAQNGRILSREDAMDALTNSNSGSNISITNNINTPLDLAEMMAEFQDFVRRNR